ncbi:MAG: RsmB/NOP family class I SAM-dependent RNA methyltransferase [Litoreibacter sp.]|nr:RsmB/NOP family class I SAM-dependent RNA methyltransferase [Litoreibacter sp.]
MTPAARLSAAIEVLDSYLDGVPLEKSLTNWARRSRFAGSKDRAAIRDIVFDCVRNRNSYAASSGALTGRGLVLAWADASNGINKTAEMFSGERHAPAPLSASEQAYLSAESDNLSCAEALDLPDWLISDFRDSYGSKTAEIANVLRQRAPVFLRANVAKADRDQCAALLADEEIETRPHPSIATALEVTANARRVSVSRAYLEGFVEVQDASSQAACLALPAATRMLDFCAGGGGKTLAYGALHDSKLFAHDANASRLKDLPARARRAGVRVTSLSSNQVRSQAPFDLVIADVPCSGSGTWRRSPAGKWSLTREKLDELIRLQARILDQAADHVIDGGCLAFMTCSGLKAENENQVAAFLERDDRFSLAREKRIFPSSEGDGFYYAHLTRVSLSS